MSKAMPSPNGTNIERAFLPSGSRVVAAYDAVPDDQQGIGELLHFLSDKLDDDDLKEVNRILGVDDSASMPSKEMAGDRRRPVAKRPPVPKIRYTEDRFPHKDRLSDGFNGRFPEAAHIKLK